jgi:hypothetical protein
VANSKFKSELTEAKDKLQLLLIELDELQTRIAKQKRMVAALTELFDIDEDSGPPVGLVTGITDACRTVIRGAEKPLLPIEIRRRVEHFGVPDQRNLPASVHTVIRRLVEANDVVPVAPDNGSGPLRYQWASPRRKSRRGLIASFRAGLKAGIKEGD